MMNGKKLTLTAVCTTHLANLASGGSRPVVLRNATAMVQHVERFFAGRMEESVSQIRPRDLKAFQADLVGRGLTPAMVNHILTGLRAMLREVRPNLPMPHPVAVHYDPLLAPDPDALRAIGESLAPPFDAMARLAQLALLRLREVVELQRVDYDPACGTVVVRNPPKGTPETVVLSTGAQRLLDHQLASHDSPWVFPGPHGRPYSTADVAHEWRTAARATLTPSLRFGDLRRAGMMALARMGASPAVITSLARLRNIRQVFGVIPMPVSEADLRKAAEHLDEA